MQFTLALGMLLLAFNQLTARAEFYPLNLESHLTEQSDSFCSFTTAEDPHKKPPLSPNEEPISKEENDEEEEVEALNESIEIASQLFRSARADYMEVLLTQRDALESKFELVEIKKQQMNAKVNLYQALGGGWN